jgi:hypothetical protein
MVWILSVLGAAGGADILVRKLSKGKTSCVWMGMLMFCSDSLTCLFVCRWHNTLPWRLFLECFILISQLPTTKGKKPKELKETIESLKGQLIDWYNEGGQNLNAMVSILEAEYVFAKDAGKGLSALKVQEMCIEAINAAASNLPYDLDLPCLACKSFLASTSMNERL